MCLWCLVLCLALNNAVNLDKKTVNNQKVLVIDEKIMAFMKSAANNTSKSIKTRNKQIWFYTL